MEGEDRFDRVAAQWHGDAELREGLAKLLREEFQENEGKIDEPKGRCGECGRGELPSEVCVNTNKGLTRFESVRCKEWGWRFPIVCSCPRWKPREDKAARLAREFWGQHDLKDEERGCFAREEIADFLRRNGVEGE